MANIIEYSIKAVDDFSAVMGKLNSSLGIMGSALKAAAAAYPVAKAVEMVKASLDMAEATGVAATKANMSAKEFSALSAAAKLSNVEVGSLSSGMKFLSNAMAEGATAPVGEALEALGIAARDATGNLRPTVDVLMDVSDQFTKSTNDANKTKAAIDLFGKAGLDMVPMLNQGSAAIKQMMVDAEALGLTITDDMAASADAVNDNFQLMGGILQGTVNKAVSAMLPTFEALSGQLIGFAKDGQLSTRIAEGLAAALKLVVTVGIGLVAAFDVVGSALGAVFAAIVQAANGDFKKAWETLKAGTADAKEKVVSAMNNIGAVWDASANSTAAAEARRMAALQQGGKSLKTHSKDADDAAKAQEQLTKSIEDSITAMQLQIAAFGMSSEQAKVMELRVKGATRAQVDRAQATADLLETLKQQQEIEREGITLTDQMRTPLEVYNDELARTNQLLGDNAISEETASRNKQKALEDYEAAIEAQHNYKEEATNIWDEFYRQIGEMSESVGNTTFQVAGIMTQAWGNFSKGTGEAVASAIMDGKNLSEGLAGVLKTVTKNVISMLVQLGLQRLILSILDLGATKTEASAKMAAGLSQVYVNSFASAAAIPLVGWLMAPGVAAANAAIAGAGAVASGAAGATIGATIGGIAHGGLDYVPAESTYLLDKGERVLSPRQNSDLTDFMQEGGNGGVVIERIEVHILENATNVEAFMQMDKVQLRETLGRPIIDALDEMFKVGLRPAFASSRV